MDQSSLNRFLTLYEWDEEKLKEKRLEMLQSVKEMRWRRIGVIAIDDTLLRLRFRIDNFYKDAKQNLGLGGCQLRSLKGTRRHWQLGFTTYSLLKARICRSRL